MYPPERSKRSKLAHHAYKHHQSWSNTSGLVAIQVETTLFKIYGPTFAHHSPFFTQLLQPAPHGDAKRAKIEGLNLYEIESVSARDFELLIRAIDDAMLVHYSLHFIRGDNRLAIPASTTHPNLHSRPWQLFCTHLPSSSFRTSAPLPLTLSNDSGAPELHHSW